MPAQEDVADVLRADLNAARLRWAQAPKGDPDERLRREQSDFLTDANHEGQHVDFHSLRHTCGAWLAMNGAHPNSVKSVMRHSSITLTMDTYGHLFPGQEAETVTRLPAMFADPPAALAATGTDEAVAGWAQNGAHQGGKTERETASIREERTGQPVSGPELNALLLSVLGEEGQGVASLDSSAPVGLEHPSNSSGNTALSQVGGAESGAVGAPVASFPPDLVVVTAAWPHLSDADRKAIVQIIRRAAVG